MKRQAKSCFRQWIRCAGVPISVAEPKDSGGMWGVPSAAKDNAEMCRVFSQWYGGHNGRIRGRVLAWWNLWQMDPVIWGQQGAPTHTKLGTHMICKRMTDWLLLGKEGALGAFSHRRDSTPWVRHRTYLLLSFLNLETAIPAMQVVGETEHLL